MNRRNGEMKNLKKLTAHRTCKIARNKMYWLQVVNRTPAFRWQRDKKHGNGKRCGAGVQTAHELFTKTNCATHSQGNIHNCRALRRVRNTILRMFAWNNITLIGGLLTTTAVNGRKDVLNWLKESKQKREREGERTRRKGQSVKKQKKTKPQTRTDNKNNLQY